MKLPERIWRGFSHAIWWLCHEWLYDLAWYVGRVTAWFVSDVTVIGADNIPRRGGVVFTANHLAQWDLLYMHNLMPRPGFFMTKEEYFEVTFLGGLVRLFGAFPVRRGKYDRQALQGSIDLLKRGKLLIVFPEGTRSKNRKLHKGQSGAAMVALKAEALIVPIAFAGTENVHWKKPVGPDGRKYKPKVIVRVGEPYRLPRVGGPKGRENYEALAALMMSKINDLLPAEYQNAGPEASEVSTATSGTSEQTLPATNSL